MKKYFRKLLVVLTGTAIVLSLTACHGTKKTNAFEVPTEFDMTRNYEITFWSKNDTNKLQTEIYNKAIEDFQKIYPNIKVNIKLYTDYNSIYNDVITNIVTGTTPNVCISYPDHIATYITGENVVVPLDSLIDNKKYGLGGKEVKFETVKKDEMIGKFVQECKIGDDVYAVPFMRSTEACYVNKTLVEKLGYTLPEKLTWDFIWEVSEKAIERDENKIYKVNGQTVMIPFIYKSTDNMMIQYLAQAGIDYSKPNGEVLIFNDDTKAFLYEVGKHAKSRAFSTFKISSYPGNFLNAGQCIFAVDSTAGATWMGSDAPLIDIPKDQLVEFETVVMEIPQVDTGNPKMISQGPSICIFNKEDPQEVLASWLFTQYLLTNEVQIAYSQTEGYIPVTKKAQESEEYQTYLSLSGTDNNEHYYVKIEASKLLLRNIDNTFTTPVFNGSASLRNAAGDLIENVSLAERRKNTVDDEFMTKLFADLTSLYRLDQIEIEGAENGGRADLGELPATAKRLLTALVVAWIGILSYLVFEYVKKKKTK